MRRVAAALISICSAVSACSGADSEVGEPPPDPEPSTSTADAPAPSELPELEIVADDGAADRLQRFVEQQLVELVATSGSELDPQVFRELDRVFVATANSDRARLEDRASGLVGTGDAATYAPQGFRSIIGSRRAASSAPQFVRSTPTQQSVDSVVKFLSVFMLLLIEHRGPGDTEPREVELSDVWTMSREQTGDRITVTMSVDPNGGTPPGSPLLDLEIRAGYDACPDEAGESDFELAIRLGLSLPARDGGSASSQLEVTATGVGLIGDDARLAGTRMEVDASQASHTTAPDGTASDASYAEASWSVESEGSSTSVDSFALGRMSSGASADDASAMAQRASDYAVWFAALVMAKAQEGWSAGQCVALTVTMPTSVAPSSETGATAAVEHRYEARVLELPVTARVTAGGDRVDPGEASGDPATFTYTAPASPGGAELTFEVRSRRGADRKVVAVDVEAGVIGVTFNGTIAYTLPGLGSIGGDVTIGKLHMRQYDGDDAALVGKWVGEGGVEVSLRAAVPGCGTATGTQTGGRVRVIGDVGQRDGAAALSLSVDEMEGGTVEMSCATAGALVGGDGISIGAGLINLGEVVIPIAPGTYPFEASGSAAGVMYEITGRAVVEEAEEFPGD